MLHNLLHVDILQGNTIYVQTFKVAEFGDIALCRLVYI